MNRQLEVVDRGCRRREMQNEFDVAGYMQIVRDVCPHQAEVGQADQVLYVTGLAREEIVYAENVVVCGCQSSA